MMQITVKIKVTKGQRCLVTNYRSKYKPWENGKCDMVNVSIKEDGTYRVSYRVVLDRKTYPKGKPWGVPLFLTVTDDGIEAE